MDEVSFSGRHNSIAKRFIFVPGFTISLCGYYSIIYKCMIFLCRCLLCTKYRFGNVNRKQYLANIILICLHVPLVVLKRSRLWLSWLQFKRNDQKRGENKSSSKIENLKKNLPSSFLVSMFPFQGLVLTSLFQATWSFVCFGRVRLTIILT